MESLVYLYKNGFFNSPLLEAKNIEKVLSNRNINIYLKWEGNNPTGTQKDRAAKLHVLNAIHNGFHEITVGTCGNFGVSIAYFAYIYNLKATIFIPKKYTNSRVNEMLKFNTKIRFIKGTYEDAVLSSVNYALTKSVYDANPGSNSKPSTNAYAYISYEIIQQLKESPYAVIVPTGNGTTLSGIYLGFKTLYEKRIIEKIPRIIATSTIYGNQIIESWNRDALVLMSKKDIRETTINEPLVAYRSFDIDSALEAIKRSKGKAYAFSDLEMIKASTLLRMKEKLLSLPASASTLLGAKKLIEDEDLTDKKIVLIITGGKYTWRKH